MSSSHQKITNRSGTNTSEDSVIIKSEESSSKKAVRPYRVLKPRFTPRQVYILASVLFTTTFYTLSVFTNQYSLLKRLFYSLLVAYLPSYFDGSEYTPEGRYWRAFALAPFWRSLFEYFPATVTFSQPLVQGKQYILSTHPHGMMSTHHGFYFTSRDFDSQLPGDFRRHLGATIVFSIPLFREWMLWGGVVDCGKPVAEAILQSGRSMVALVGGISEQTRSENGRHQIFIRSRKGIFELALRFGVAIVPSYCFGEDDLLYSVSLFSKVRAKLSDILRIPFCIGYGDYGFMPRKIPLKCFVGAPIEVKKVENPTKDQIMQLQQQYVDSITSIFEQHKADCGYPNGKLEVK